MAIHELVVITDEVKSLLMKQASVQEIKKHVQQQGVQFLLDDGLKKVQAGQTTLEEVLRVASFDL